VEERGGAADKRDMDPVPLVLSFVLAVVVGYFFGRITFHGNDDQDRR